MKICDAHCHFELAAGKEGFLETDSIAVCAAFENEWELLKNIEAKNFGVRKIKKIFGAHPACSECETSMGREKILRNLEKYLPFADALGETGFDGRYFEKFSKQEQSEFFEAQINMARKFKVPLVMHCVGAWGDALNVLKKNFAEFGNIKFLIHAASCSSELTENFQNLGAFFSFGERELLREKGRECAISAEKIMLESDMLRSSRVDFNKSNFSSSPDADESVLRAAQIMSQTKGFSFEDILEKNSKNFSEFYSP